MIKAYDAVCRHSIEALPCRSIPWYLSTSYAYYVLDRPLITDACFDALCRFTNQHWRKITHRHKRLVERTALAAGTCFLRAEDYPTIARSAAERLLLNLEG